MAELGLTIAAVVCLLLIAVLLQPLARRTGIPHTVWLTLAGLVLGLALPWLVSGSSGQGADFFSELGDLGLKAESIFFLLLIPLVFDAAIRINVRYLMDDLGPVLLMSIAGTVLTVLFIGYGLASWTNQPLLACLLVGAIASSTDPAPIQEVFESMGVPKRVNLLVEAESLVGDSTALVAYALLLGMLVDGQEPTALSIIGEFVLVSLGGIIGGFLVGRLFCSLMGRVATTTIARNVLVLCMAFFAYFLFEEVLPWSGVIAVLVAALVLCTHGKSTYSPSRWLGLLDLSGQVHFMAKSVIFLLVGMVVPTLIQSFTSADLFLVGGVFLAAFLARALVIFGLLPALTAINRSHPIPRGVKIIMFWGGSRGAISLAMALAILGTAGIAPDTARFVATISCAFVLATLFINSTTMKPLLKVLRLNKLDRLDEAIRDRALFDALSDLRDDLQYQLEGSGSDRALLQEAVDDFDTRARALFDTMARRSHLAHDEWVVIGLTAVARYEQRIYMKYLENRLITPTQARSLLGQVGDLIDAVRHNGARGYYKATDRALAYRWFERMLFALQRWTGIRGLLRDTLAERYAMLFTMMLVMEEIDEHADTRVAKLVYADVLDDVLLAVRTRLDAVRDALNQLQSAYPAYGEALEKQLHRLSVARLELQKYEDMLDQAMIGPEVFEELALDVGQRIDRLSRTPALDLALSGDDMIATVPALAALDDATRKALAGHCRSRLAAPGDLLIRKGEPGDGLWFVADGAVQVLLPERTVTLGRGAFFGEMALLNDAPRMADVISAGYSRLLVLDREGFEKLTRSQPTVREEILKAAEARGAEPPAPPGATRRA